MDANNRLNRVFPLFNPLSDEFSPGSRLIDIFPSQFSFHLFNQTNKESKAVHIYKLDKYILYTLTDSKTVAVVFVAIIKN